METEAQPTEQLEPVANSEELPKPVSKEDFAQTAPVAQPQAPNASDSIPAPINGSKEGLLKPSPKKPKKRKPKVPRDVTAPRQPLTGMCTCRFSTKVQCPTYTDLLFPYCM